MHGGGVLIAMIKSQPGSGNRPNKNSPPSGASSHSDTEIESVKGQQQDLRGILSSVLTGEVIPRVYRANLAKDAGKARVDQNTVNAFTKVVLRGSFDDCMDFVNLSLEHGISIRDMCRGLFPSTARHLGELWDDDRLSFAEVTIGLGRLHNAVHEVSTTDTSLATPGARHNIIFASALGDQHAFGVLLVSKVFEMEGWLVAGGPDLHTGDELAALVCESWFDIVGLSASSEDLALSLRPEIKRLHVASLNPDVFIMVGGAGFSGDAHIAEKIGADVYAADADEAILKARHLLSLRESRTSH